MAWQKIDYHINEKTFCTACIMPDRIRGSPLNSTRSLSRIGGRRNATRSQIIGTTWNYVPNSSIVNEARFGVQPLYAGLRAGRLSRSGAGQPDALFAQEIKARSIVDS